MIYLIILGLILLVTIIKVIYEDWTCNMVFLPMFGFSSLTAAKAFGIGLVFTGVSLVRQYVLRRWFNGLRWGNREVKA